MQRHPEAGHGISAERPASASLLQHAIDSDSLTSNAKMDILENEKNIITNPIIEINVGPEDFMNGMIMD